MRLAARSDPSPAFACRKRVRFAHCDPAGIVFYPRHFELLNEVVEDWFGAGLGAGFPMLHAGRGIGVPAARISCEFPAPSRLGDVLDFALRVERVGRTSLEVSIGADCADQPRVRARITLVFVVLATGRPEPIPADILRALA